MKDKKLMGKDFFDSEEYPLATFRSTGVTETGPDSFTVIGDFTVRGVTNGNAVKGQVPGQGTVTKGLGGLLGHKKQ